MGIKDRTEREYRCDAPGCESLPYRCLIGEGATTQAPFKPVSVELGDAEHTAVLCTLHETQLRTLLVALGFTAHVRGVPSAALLFGGSR